MYRKNKKKSKRKVTEITLKEPLFKEALIDSLAFVLTFVKVALVSAPQNTVDQINDRNLWLDKSGM